MIERVRHVLRTLAFAMSSNYLTVVAVQHRMGQFPVVQGLASAAHPCTEGMPAQVRCKTGVSVLILVLSDFEPRR